MVGDWFMLQYSQLIQRIKYPHLQLKSVSKDLQKKMDIQNEIV